MTWVTWEPDRHALVQEFIGERAQQSASDSHSGFWEYGRR